MHKIKKDDSRNNTTWGLKKDSPAKSETGKTEFTVAGILRDADSPQLLQQRD